MTPNQNRDKEGRWSFCKTKCVVIKNGVKTSVNRLWVEGKYVRDPKLTFSEDERRRIKNNIAAIRARIEAA